MILGITGKIGVGKDTVATFFEQRNWVVRNADKMAHELYRPYKRVWKQLVKRFGEDILRKDDVIDRQKLRQLVFGPDTETGRALKDLNAIVHPELNRVLKDDLYFLKKRNKNVVVTATLWKELGLFDVCDKVLLIRAGDALTYKRVHKRDGMPFDMFEGLNAKQSEPPHADFVVENEGDFQALYKQLNAVLNAL